MLIDNAAVYELKTARALIGEHKAQALHYLFLLGLHHGKLINFRPKSVEYEFVSNRITPAVRYDLRIEDSKWQDLDGESIWLKTLFGKLLAEWGAFLDTGLFYEAIVH